jgi:tRNA threonylcarbamoyl adenosine modification protein (Sua5/YciO/YrdC/YwlC family)
MILQIDVQRPAPRRLQPAIEALQRGEVVIYPTDTGYAFGCALSSAKAIAKLRKLKGIHDKHEKPLTMLVRDVAEVGRYGHMGNRVFRVVRRLLPGPYTIVLHATSDVPRAMKNRHHEVGVRVPNHAACHMLVDLLGEPLLTGSVTPAESDFAIEDAEDLERAHGRDVRVVIDGGPLWPDPSTVLRLTDDEIEVLREGQGPLPE